MENISLEHANITVSDSEKTAAWMQTVFGRRIRWQGPALNTGYMGSHWNKRSVSDAVLPCRSAENTV